MTAAVLLLCATLLIVLVVFGAPLFAIALPAVIVGTMASIARPATGFVVIIFFTGFIGTIIAFTGLPADALSQMGLLCLWFAAVGIHLAGRAERKVWLWPALVLPLFYLALTLIQMFTSDDLGLAFADFRVTAWYMMAVVLLALGPWSAQLLRRIAYAFIIVAVLVGLYALYRYIAGPSVEEFSQARDAVQRVAFSVPVRFFGSFLSAFQLAAWSATILPFLLAVAFVLTGRWRIGAITAIGLCSFAVFASDVRSGLVAAVLGVAAVMILFMLCRAFDAKRFAVGGLATIGIAITGIAGYAVVISDSPESSDRFSKILNPSEDFAFQQRLTRWEGAYDVIDDEPFGHGLGTQGFIGQNKNPDGQTGPFNLDSSYLKVAIQQGYFVMLLFVAALFSILVGLVQRSVTTRDPWRSALGIGAVGALVAQMFLFFMGIYSEGLTALSAWILVGLGCAGFTTLSDDDLLAEPETHVPSA